MTQGIEPHLEGASPRPGVLERDFGLHLLEWHLDDAASALGSHERIGIRASSSRPVPVVAEADDVP